MSAKLQLTSVTIGTPNPHVLAPFYAKLLGGELTADDGPGVGRPPEDGWAQVRTTSDFGQITLNFEYDAAWQVPVWPSEHGKQHITQHLDIRVDNLEAAIAHAIDCGAKLDPFQPQESVRVMRDPHGHPFCLFLGG